MRRIVCALWIFLFALPALAASSGEGRPALLYLGTWPHKIDVIDINSEKVIDRIDVDADVVRQLVLSPDRKTLYAETLAGNCIDTIDLASRRQTDSFCLDKANYKNRLSGLAIDPTGKYMYATVTKITKQIDHYDIATPQFLALDLAAKSIVRSADMPKDENGNPFRGAMRVSPDGKYLYVFRDRISVFDTSNFKLTKTIDLRQPPVPNMLDLSLNLAEDPNEDPGKVTGLFRSEDPYIHQEVFGIAEVDLAKLSFDVTPIGPVTTTSISPLLLTPDRKMAYTAVVNGVNGNRITEFWAFDMDTKRMVEKKVFNGRTRFNFGLTADGKKLLIYNAGFQIEVYDAKTMEMVSDIDLGGDTTSNLIVMPHDD